VNALPVQHPDAFSPMNAHRVEAERELLDASARSESGCIPEDKLSSRSSDFANEPAPDACHSATRAGHVTCSETWILNRADLRTFSEFEGSSWFM